MKNSNKLAGIRMLLILMSGVIFCSCLGNVLVTVEELGPNIVVNGDMEEGKPPVGWIAGDVILSADNDSNSGKQSLKIFGLNHSSPAYQNVPVKPDTKYRVELWYKGSEWFGDAYVFIRVGNDSKVITKRFSEDNWTRWTAEFDTGTASNATMGFYVWWNDYVLIDDVSIREVLNPAATTAQVIKEAPIDTSPAAKQKQADIARKNALHSWQAIFPERKYILWAKSPWDKLRKINLPPAPVKECREISLAMGGNEYESTSFVLTNLSDKAAEFAVSADGAGIPVTLRKALWVTTHLGKEVNDALPLLEDSLFIPAGESREVWLTMYSRGVKPGDYNPLITITSPGLPASIVNLKIKVYPVSLPDDKPIYLNYWEYLEPTWITPELAQAQVEDLKQHYVNTPTVHPWSLMPKTAGQPLTKDYTKLDGVLYYYIQLNPKMIALNLLAEGYLENTPGFSSEEWKAHFKSWLTGLVSHLKEKGFGYDRFCIQPYDERLDEKVCNMAKLIKEIDPNILVYVNSPGTKAQAKAISPYVDILCAGIDSVDRIYGTHPADANLDYKLLAKKQEYFWTYANPMPPFPQAVSPYSWYRMAVWRAWQEDAEGFGYWIYSYKTQWNSYNKPQNWSVVYFANAPDAPPELSKKELVVTSKRWEATREGVEDYVYLHMLKEVINRAGNRLPPELLAEAKKVLKESPRMVLDDKTNTSLADKAKEDILKVLTLISSEL